MQKAFMIAHQVRQPNLLPIKLLSTFCKLDGNEPPPGTQLASFNLYTKNTVFEGELYKGQINSQLTWNEQCIAALTQSLNGRRNNIEIEFNEIDGQLSLICEIESGIHVKMFNIILRILHD